MRETTIQWRLGGRNLRGENQTVVSLLHSLVLYRSTTMAMSPWELEPLVATLHDPSHSEGLQ